VAPHRGATPPAFAVPPGGQPAILARPSFVFPASPAVIPLAGPGHWPAATSVPAGGHPAGQPGAHSSPRCTTTERS